MDWLLSLDPDFRSSAFGMALGVMQMLAALGWARCWSRSRRAIRGKAGDLARLMIAAALGAIYLGFAEYLVAWYGNLPHKAAWYLRRQALPWILLDAGAVALTRHPAGHSRCCRPSCGAARALLAWIGAGVLLGILLLHRLAGRAALRALGARPAAALGTLGMGGIWLGLAGWPLRRAADAGMSGDTCAGLADAASRPISGRGWCLASGSGPWPLGAVLGAGLAVPEPRRRRAAGAGLRAPAAFPAPQLQSDPAGDLRDYQAAQRARLSVYAWADRERGLVRIPSTAPWR